jgi:hypothetical protein
MWHFLCHIEFFSVRLNKNVRHSSVPQLHALSRHPHHFITSPIHLWYALMNIIAVRHIHTTSNTTYEA